VDFAYEDHEAFPSLRVVNEDLKESEYKLGGRIQLCIVPAKDSGRKRRRNIWVAVVACHRSMWTKDDDYFFQDEFIDKKDGDGKLIQFNPKNVIEHLPAKRFKDMTPVEQAKWFTSGRSDSDSDSSDSDLKIPLPYRTILYSKSKKTGMTNVIAKILEKIKLARQSDASPPESAPTPEQSAAAAPVAEQAEATQVAPPECIVPPRAPMYRRRPGRPRQ